MGTVVFMRNTSCTFSKTSVVLSAIEAQVTSPPLAPILLPDSTFVRCLSSETRAQTNLCS